MFTLRCWDIIGLWRTNRGFLLFEFVQLLSARPPCFIKDLSLCVSASFDEAKWFSRPHIHARETLETKQKNCWFMFFVRIDSVDSQRFVDTVINRARRR